MGDGQSQGQRSDFKSGEDTNPAGFFFFFPPFEIHIIVRSETRIFGGI